MDAGNPVGGSHGAAASPARILWIGVHANTPAPPRRRKSRRVVVGRSDETVGIFDSGIISDPIRIEGRRGVKAQKGDFHDQPEMNPFRLSRETPTGVPSSDWDMACIHHGRGILGIPSRSRPTRLHQGIDPFTDDVVSDAAQDPSGRSNGSPVHTRATPSSGRAPDAPDPPAGDPR